MTVGAKEHLSSRVESIRGLSRGLCRDCPVNNVGQQERPDGCGHNDTGTVCELEALVKEGLVVAYTDWLSTRARGKMAVGYGDRCGKPSGESATATSPEGAALRVRGWAKRLGIVRVFKFYFASGVDCSDTCQSPPRVPSRPHALT